MDKLFLSEISYVHANYTIVKIFPALPLPLWAFTHGKVIVSIPWTSVLTNDTWAEVIGMTFQKEQKFELVVFLTAVEQLKPR